MPYRSTFRKTRRKHRGGAQALLNYATRGKTPTDTVKSHKKISKIMESLSKGSPTKLKSYTIPHIDRTFDFSSAKTYGDPDLSPLGDDTDKFKGTLYKMPYAQLKKLPNNPQSWSQTASDMFMMTWRTTPSPKKLPSAKKSSGFFSMFDFSGKKKKKPRKTKKKKPRKTKKKKGKTHRR
jgi:hypothetical protein